MTKTKKRKESILKMALSVLNCAYLIADISDKSANRGSTILYPCPLMHEGNNFFFKSLFYLTCAQLQSITEDKYVFGQGS